MSNDREKDRLLLPEEETVFLRDVERESRRAAMPVLLIVAIALAAAMLLWKTAVRQPENRQAAIEAALERNEETQRLIEQRVLKERAEYLRKNPNKHKKP